MSKNEDIAIVGMSCLFPGADNLETFWHNIVNKVDCIGVAPPDWHADRFVDESGEDPSRSYTRHGGFLGDLSRFDPLKYGVVPGTVDGSEPDHFIALRCAFEAMADAGFPETPVNREKTGVIVGRGLFVNRGVGTILQRTVTVEEVIRLLQELDPDRSAADLKMLRQQLLDSLPPANADTFPGLVHSALVGRIANRLDLNGPAYTVDAACAAALIAVEHGTRELRSGNCDAVIVGGAQVSLPAPVAMMFCQIGALSRRGLIAPFSAEANGTLLGQGCGMLVLKRRSTAERDGNRIYAFVKSVAGSSDGKGVGLLAPRTEGQQLAIKRAWERSGLDKSTMSYVEAHGTGIPMGDATEMHSLITCFDDGGAREQIAVGSVKSMLGHLIPAAGAASMIKTALALYHRVLPPTLHAEQPNPELGLPESPFYLCCDPQPWLQASPSHLPRAGINSFGFGGANAHAILEAPERGVDEENLERCWPYELVVLRAADREALCTLSASLGGWLDQSTGLRLLDVAASCASVQGESVLAIVAKDLEDLRLKLAHASKLLADPARKKIQDRNGIFWYAEPLARSGRVAFMFPGEGCQYPGMHAALCRSFPAVREQFELTAQALARSGDAHAFSRALFPQPAHRSHSDTVLYEMETAVAAVTAGSRGLLELLNQLGVSADAVVGHSSGEFSACLAAGVFVPKDKDELKRSIIDGFAANAEVAREIPLPKVTLLSVGGTAPGAVEAVVAQADGRIVVAMDNCPHQKILLGDEEIMNQAMESLRGKGGMCERLPWDRPYHSDLFEPASGVIDAYAKSLHLQSPKLDFWSCATAARFPEEPSQVSELLVRQWHSPVRFTETVQQMHDDGVRLFVEVGPRSNLSAFVGDILKGSPHCAVPMDVHTRHDLDQLCRATGMLVAHGVPVRVEELYQTRAPMALDFSLPPPGPRKPDPVLDLSLPFLVLSEEMRERFSRRPPATVSAPPAAAEAPVETALVPDEIAEPPAHRAMHPPPATNGSWHAAEAVAAPVPAANGDTRSQGINEARRAALSEFQHTMRDFLSVQESVLSMRQRGHGLVAPTPVSTPLPAPPAPVAAPVPVAQAPVTRALPAQAAAAPAAVPAPPPFVTPVIAPKPETRSPAAPVPSGFIDDVLEFEPGKRIVAECELDLERHAFLLDHTFFNRGLSRYEPDLMPLPVTPLALTLEIMCQTAARLRPGEHVRALTKLKLFRWLAMVTPTRRVRMEAEDHDDGSVRVRIMEADKEGMSGEIAQVSVEFTAASMGLGPARLAQPAPKPPPWSPAETYTRVLYHGASFQGLDEITHWSTDRVAARLANPVKPLLPGAILALPAQVIDFASQMPGTIHRSFDPNHHVSKLAFPNTFERIEFATPFPRGVPLQAVSELMEATTVFPSNTEVQTLDGDVVMRYWGKIEEVVEFPRRVYEYTFDPHKIWVNEDLTGLFDGVPGIENCAIAVSCSEGYRLFVRRVWAQILARLVLDAEERRQFDAFASTPVTIADWLIGRMAAKDAVRMLRELDCTMIEVPIRRAESGQPLVALDSDPPIHMSLSHHDFHAVAAAADASVLSGVGIDFESDVEPMSQVVVEDAFSAPERALIEARAIDSQWPADRWYRAAWCAKEAIGKALGEGLPQGPRQVEILSLDETDGRISARVLGPLAAAFGRLDTGQDSTTAASSYPTLDVWCRLHDARLIALCPLPRHAVTR